MKRKSDEIVVPKEVMNYQKEYAASVRAKNMGVPKKYIIHTFGCQMNEHDSEKLAGMLADMGYEKTSSEKEADMIVFNTCCVRENAELKVLGNVGALKTLKESKPATIIAVCGCMMQQKDVVDFIKNKFRHVDIIFGTHNLHLFPEMVLNLISSGERIIDVWEKEGRLAEEVPIERKDEFRAYVTIMYGCNNFCSYCIVPYVRGRERSRRPEDIVREVSDLCKNGVKEITLLGQNVNSYGKDLENGMTFTGLLKELNKTDGLYRIRFMTSHPKDLSEDLIEAIKNLDKVCESLHLPFQSGSTKVLQEMNRSYTKEEYLELCKKIRYHIPTIALSTDVIVGFPGETEEDFQDTLDVIEKVGFDQAFMFMYSQRSGTPADKRTDQVPEDIKKERFDRLLKLQNESCRIRSEAYRNTVCEVLVEGTSRSNHRRLTGRTRTNKIVNFDGEISLVGELVNVKISEARTWSLEGWIVEE